MYWVHIFTRFFLAVFVRIPIFPVIPCERARQMRHYTTHTHTNTYTTCHRCTYICIDLYTEKCVRKILHNTLLSPFDFRGRERHQRQQPHSHAPHGGRGYTIYIYNMLACVSMYSSSSVQSVCARECMRKRRPPLKFLFVPPSPSCNLRLQCRCSSLIQKISYFQWFDSIKILRKMRWKFHFVFVLSNYYIKRYQQLTPSA